MKKSVLSKALVLAALLATVVGGTASAGGREPQFAPAKNYENPGSGRPQNLAKGDFDEDGVLDLAMSVADSPDGGVSLFEGRPDGTFKEPREQLDVVAESASFVITSDFNGDKHLDLAISDLGADPDPPNPPNPPGSVVILLGKGDGTFRKPESFPSGGVFPVGLAAPDFDDDGDKDLAVVNGGSASDSPNVTILVNEGNKDFETGQTIPLGSGRGSGAVDVAKGDFDKDNDPDLVVTTSASDERGPLPGSIVVLENAEGVYVPAQPVPVGLTPQFIVVGFFDDDGNLDFANTNVDSNNVSVRLGNGDGTFTSAGDFPSGGDEPTGITAADFNQDGKKDLAVTNVPGGTGNIGVLAGRGDGTFETPETFVAGEGSAGILAGKFNRNKKVDLATANLFSNDLSVLINKTKK